MGRRGVLGPCGGKGSLDLALHGLFHHLQPRFRQPGPGQGGAQVLDRVATGEFLEIAVGAIDLLIVGICMVAQPFETSKQDQRSAAAPDARHRVGAGGDCAIHVPAAEAEDRQPEQVVDLGAVHVEHRSPAGHGGNGPAVILDQEQHRRRLTRGFGEGFQHFALLGCAVAHGADHDRAVGGVLQCQGCAHRLKRVVAHRPDQRGDVAVAPAVVGAHLPAGGLRGGRGEESREDLLQRQARRHHQRLVAVVREEPVLRLHRHGKGCGHLVAGAGDMEVPHALIDQRLFLPVHEPCPVNRPVQGREIGFLAQIRRIEFHQAVRYSCYVRPTD